MYFMVFQLDLFRSDESSLSFVHIQLQNSKYYLRNFPHTLFARHSWNRKSRYSILHLLTQTSGCKKLSDKTGIISNFHVFVKLRHKAGKVSNKSFFSRWQEGMKDNIEHGTWKMVCLELDVSEYLHFPKFQSGEVLCQMLTRGNHRGEF